MFCISCERETQTSPCERCGGDPFLDGRYCLRSLIGGSRFSRTWSAVLGSQRVAVQELPLGFVDPEEISQLVEHEISLLQSFDHPGVVRTFEGLVSRMGNRLALFLVQEFIEGDTLEQEAAARGRFTLDEVLDVIGELSRTLEYLHAKNPPVLHRNIKPANIVRRRSDGSLVLIDFGAVRDILRDLDGRPGAGSDGYASPEQRRGRLGPKADLYGVGVTALRLLTGLGPAELTNPDNGQLDWQRHAHVGASVQWLLQGLVDADPSRRVRDTRELGLRLKTVRGPKRSRKERRRSSLQPLSEGLGGGLAAIPQSSMSLEDAETVLYQGDEGHLASGGLSELDGDNDTFYGLPGPDGPRRGPPGRSALSVDDRLDQQVGIPAASDTLVAMDSDISEPPSVPPADRQQRRPQRRPPAPRPEPPALQGDLNHPRDGHGADPFNGPMPEMAPLEAPSLSGRKRGRNQRGVSANPSDPERYRQVVSPDPYKRPDALSSDPRRQAAAPPPAPPPPEIRRRPDPAAAAPPEIRRRPDPAATAPPPERPAANEGPRRLDPWAVTSWQEADEHSKSIKRTPSLPPPMPSVGPTPAEIARSPSKDIFAQAGPPPPPFQGRRPNATLPPPPPPPQPKSAEPETIAAIDPTASAPGRSIKNQPPLKPRPRPPEPPEGFVVPKGLAIAGVGLVVALVLLLIMVVVVLVTR